MPMYEYGCNECQASFDRLRRMDQGDEGVVCPRCGNAHVRRKLSVFAAFSKSSGGTVTAAAGSGGCACSSGGGCGCASAN
jgi:putative FmdB family regulatory protein